VALSCVAAAADAAAVMAGTMLYWFASFGYRSCVSLWRQVGSSLWRQVGRRYVDRLVLWGAEGLWIGVDRLLQMAVGFGLLAFGFTRR